MVTDFDTTPIMSTYLVAFIVSDLDYREFNGTTSYLTKHRAFSVKDHVNQTSYALNLGVNVLKTLDQYLNVPNRFTKLDHSAIPGVFCDGIKYFFIVNKR